MPPSAEAKRFLDETTGAEKPRVFRNAVLLLAPARDGLEVACGNGSVLCIATLQLPGGKPLSVLQLLNARRDQLAPGQSFGA